MNLSSQIKKSLKFIEGKRHSKNLLFLLLVLLKDISWAICYFIPYELIGTTAKNNLFYFTANLFKKYREPVKTYYKISFCITCMGRLQHLKKTLKKSIRHNLDYPKLEFVLLDYNSNDGLQEWVFKNFKEELVSGTLVYYRTTEPQRFHMANAKNIAHQLASGDIVCNLDADNYTGRDFAFFINSTMQSSTDIIGAYQKSKSTDPDYIKSCGGRIFLTKNNFIKLGGYDENFIGWGHEDDEFKIRACALGLKKSFIPHFFLSSIPHNNHLRENNMGISLEDSGKRNMNILESVKNSGRTYVKNKPIDFNKIKRIKLEATDITTK